MEHAASRRTPIGPILAIVGGALLAVGSFLSWAEVSGGGVSVSAKGIDGSDGWITLGAGVLAIVVGIAGMARGGRRALAVLAIIAGLVGGGLGVYDAMTAEDSVLDAAAEEIAPQLGATAEEVRGLLDDAIDSGQLDISIAFGLYIVIAGGVIALVGGAIQMAGGGASAPAMPMGASAGSMPPAAAPPSEETPSVPPAAPASPAPPPTPPTPPEAPSP